MAAIALAESSGNPNATNPTDNGGTQTSWGLWQISNGTHNQPVANVLNPQVNAAQAVAKYNASGFAPWGTYKTGAYRQFLPKGTITPSGVAPISGASTGSSGSSILQQLEDPFHIINGIGTGIADLVTKPADIATSLTSIAQDVGALGSLLNTMLTDALWLFKPSNWIRVIAFAFGVGTLLPGVWMLSKAGQGQGDISLALGIFLVILSGVLLFIAFHNVPENITSLGALLGWISDDLRKNSPVTSH
jgi:hypothetical protein